MTYRKPASDDATIDDLRAENARLRSRLAGKRVERRERRAKWWREKRGIVVAWSVAIPSLIFGAASIWRLVGYLGERSADYFDAQLACAPGAIDADGYNRPEWRYRNPRVICIRDGERWIVNRGEPAK